MTERTII